MAETYPIDDDEVSVEDIEIRLLLEAIYQMYGYDFRSYSRASMRRRINSAQRRYPLAFEPIGSSTSKLGSSGKTRSAADGTMAWTARTCPAVMQ